MTRQASSFMLAVAALALSSCGYHVGAGADLVPKSIQTIAIPAFGTFTTHYKLVDTLPQQIGREFEARTRFRVERDPSQADAVLTGRINTVQMSPIVQDPTSAKTTEATVIVVVNLTLTERATGRVLFNRSGLAFRQNYDVSIDPHQYFDESGPALDRLSRDLARDVVSAIVENF